MSNEPQLPPHPPSGSIEPALSSLFRCGDALLAIGVEQALIDRANCAERTVSEWWRDCREAYVMAWCLPEGRPDSPSRKKFVLTACRCVRLAQAGCLFPNERPWQLIGLVEDWARGDPAVTTTALHEVSRNDSIDLHAYAASGVIHAAIASSRCAYYFVYAMMHAGDSCGMDEREFDAQCADIIREMYPDPGAAFTERQAERAAAR